MLLPLGVPSSSQPTKKYSLIAKKEQEVGINCYFTSYGTIAYIRRKTAHTFIHKKYANTFKIWDLIQDPDHLQTNLFFQNPD